MENGPVRSGDAFAILTELARRTAVAATNEIEEVAFRQSEMFARISDSIRALGEKPLSGNPGSSLEAIVTVAQMEDPLRQRLEDVAAALRALGSLLRESGEDVPAELASRVTDALRLRDVRMRFLACLTGRDEGPGMDDTDTDGNIELF